MPAGLRRAVFFRAVTIRGIQFARSRTERQGSVERTVFGAAPVFRCGAVRHTDAPRVYNHTLVSATSQR